MSTVTLSDKSAVASKCTPDASMNLTLNAVDVTDAALVTSAMPIQTRVPVAVTSADAVGYAKLPLRTVTSETATCALGV